jgi:hypothetical protein
MENGIVFDFVFLNNFTAPIRLIVAFNKKIGVTLNQPDRT